MQLHTTAMDLFKRDLPTEFIKKNLQNQMKNKHVQIRVITKLPNTEQSFNEKGKTHKSTNRQNQSTTGKLYENPSFIIVSAERFN